MNERGLSLQAELVWEVGADVVRAISLRRSRKIALSIEAQPQGARTWIVVTAQVARRGDPVVVRRCRAEIYADFGGCVGPRPVRSTVVNLLPQSHVTLHPGDLPARWDSYVLNEHIRREARHRDREAMQSTYGKEADRMLAVYESTARARSEWLAKHPALQRLATVVSCPSERIRVVVETADRGDLITDDVRVPPPTPLNDRLEQVLTLIGRRSRPTDPSADRQADLRSGSCRSEASRF